MVQHHNIMAFVETGDWSGASGWGGGVGLKGGGVVGVGCYRGLYFLRLVI